ncbi:Macrolide export ATP-binding/permease protein MacB [Luteitalea pratensis]|uniref:Macrolide export ATP-binding/permease protein MacB n=2 Tax=Luteitalea pratensis TaxID=1855912 RepID=A0A143PHA7_LUTPR|nr:Macrolide export ATP-binding/permease protein MacB [Luteitalea pratensis]
MTSLRRFMKRLAASALGRRDDERMREELAEHLEMLVQEQLRTGLPLDEARRRARLKLGGPDALAEAYRDEQRLGWLENLGKDLRYGLRSVRRNPGLSAVAIGTLALGIGANLAIFSLVNAMLIRPLPFRDAEALALVHLLMPEDDAPGVYRRTIWSYPKYEVVRAGQQVFSATSLFTDTEWSLTKAGEPERIQGEVVEAAYFPLLGIDARLGRLFSADDDRVGATPVAVIGHGVWQRRFGNDPGVLGKAITLDGTVLTIVGVTPQGFRGLSGRAEVWRPLKPTVPFDLNEPFSHSYHLIARRRPGVSLEQVDTAVRTLGAQIDATFPVPRSVGKSGVAAVSLNDERIDPLLRRAALVLLGAVGLVLLIACVNLANLTLVRGLARQREVAIRLALGASRLRIGRQFFIESLLLSVAGAAAGALVATLSIRLASAAVPDLNAWLHGPTGGLMRVGASMLGVDTTVAALAVALGLVSAMLFGIVPAWQAARGDLTSPMKPVVGGHHAMGSRGQAFRNGLLVAEVALALVMLVSAGLMLKSLIRLNQTDLGFRPDHVLTFQIALPGDSYPPERSIPFIEQLLAKLKARPEVQAVAFGHCAPVMDRCNGTRATFPDRAPVPAGSGPLVGVTWVSPGVFDALGIRLVRGRGFTERDRQGQPKVVVINETAAKQLWAGDDPIGKRISIGQGGFRDGAEVIGVAADVRYRAVETPPGPDVYIPVLQSPRPFGLIFVRSRLPSSALVPMIRHEVASLDRDLPLSDIKSMDERYGEATWRTWAIGVLLSIFAVLALVLAVVGVFAVLAQSVAQRTREIGVRMALGAAPHDIQRLVLGRAVTIAAVGVGIGLGAAWLSSRLLTTLLYEVEPHDAGVLSLVALLLVVVTIVASYIPAYRAARVDPLETVRAE